MLKKNKLRKMEGEKMMKQKKLNKNSAWVKIKTGL